MFLKNNIPAILWALLILFLCGIPGKDLPDLSFWESLSFDKVFHLGLFLVLSILMVRGFENQTSFSAIKKYARILVLIFAVFYGGLTEILQGTLFVGRHASIFDFIANFTGTVMGVILYKQFVRLIPNFARK